MKFEGVHTNQEEKSFAEQILETQTPEELQIIEGRLKEKAARLDRHTGQGRTTKESGKIERDSQTALLDAAIGGDEKIDASFFTREFDLRAEVQAFARRRAELEFIKRLREGGNVTNERGDVFEPEYLVTVAKAILEGRKDSAYMTRADDLREELQKILAMPTGLEKKTE